MTFKEFVQWCNERACDGLWRRNIARLCIDVMEIVRAVPRWRREKVWQKINKTFEIVDCFVKATEREIAIMLAGGEE